MLQHISWPTYFTWCFITVLLYYTAIGILYFRAELTAIARRPGETKRFHVDSAHTTVTTGNDNASLAATLIDELVAFAEATGSKHQKDEVMFGLSTIIRKYAALEASEYKKEINSNILMACENNCLIELSEEDVAFLWKG